MQAEIHVHPYIRSDTQTLVVERPLSADEQDTIRVLIIERLGHPFRLSFSYPERIERSRSGKFEEFVSRMATRADALP